MTDWDQTADFALPHVIPLPNASWTMLPKVSILSRREFSGGAERNSPSCATLPDPPLVLGNSSRW